LNSQAGWSAPLEVKIPSARLSISICSVEFPVGARVFPIRKNGFIVVLPEAVTEFARGGTTWNIPFENGVDDVAFVTNVLDAVGSAFCVDQSRIYAIGYSGGARLASQLACQIPDRIAAIGAVGGLRHPHDREGECRRAERTVPIIAFHSVDDPINLSYGQKIETVEKSVSFSLPV
jgi:poly(3-hydroxybutyrate) depolymerase